MTSPFPTPRHIAPYALLPALLAILLVVSGCDQADPDLEGEDTEFAEGCDDPDELRLFVNPLQTFLRVSERDRSAGARDVTPLRLADLGIAPGDSLRLERLGEFQYNASHPDRVYYGLVVLFSATNELLPWNVHHRVPGAIAVGTPHETRPTYYDNLPTDIPEDFVVGMEPSGDPEVSVETPVYLRVPEGARYLFLSPDDDHFADNLDEDEDFSLCINLIE